MLLPMKANVVSAQRCKLKTEHGRQLERILRPPRQPRRVGFLQEIACLMRRRHKFGLSKPGEIVDCRISTDLEYTEAISSSLDRF